MRTKRTIWMLPVLLTCSLITACGVPESIHPLSPPDEAVPDPSLDGAWAGIPPDGTEDGSLHMYIQSADSGLMDVVLVIHDDEILETLRYEAHVTPAGNTRYVNARFKFLAAPEGADGKVDIENSEWRIADRYLFAKYSLSDDGLLHLWFLHDSRTLTDAIGSGELRSEEAGGNQFGGSETLITDEPEWILKFLEGRDHDEIFEGPTIFRRLDAAPVSSQRSGA
jgi:hypothetical protein